MNYQSHKLKEETSPTQFKSLLKLVLMIKLYSDYWFVTASYILYYGWCLCRPVLVFFPCTVHFFATFFAIFWFSFAVLYLYPSEFTYNSQPALMIPGFSGCLCCIYILFRLLVFKLNMMMMMMMMMISDTKTHRKPCYTGQWNHQLQRSRCAVRELASCG